MRLGRDVYRRGNHILWQLLHDLWEDRGYVLVGFEVEAKLALFGLEA